jgi:hypothetical protein
MLVDRPLEVGAYTAVLDATGLPAGVYVGRLTTATQAATLRFTVVK